MWRRVSTQLQTLLSPKCRSSLNLTRSLTSASSSSFPTTPFQPTPTLFSHRATSDSDNILSKGRKKVEDVMPIATGHEHEELAAELEGRNILEMNFPVGPFGTKEAPAIVQSVYDKRIVGCPGGEGARLGETITECLSEAQSDSHEVQQKALQTLVSITKVSPQNRNLLAQTDDAVPAFLTLSKSSSSTVQTLSLSILFNLSLNPNLKQSLAEMETINHLNSIILSPDSESSKLASSLICSLAMLDKNKAKFGVAGTVQSLVEAVSGPRSPAAHHLLSCLAELVQFHGNCTIAVRSGAVPVLIQVVESIDGEDLAGTSLAVLGLLARFGEGLNALRKTDQIVSSMVDVLKGRCMLSKEGAAEILLRLFEESEGCVRDALRLPELSTVLADLSVRGSGRAREKVDLLMKKMMEADLDCYVDGNPIFLQW